MKNSVYIILLLCLVFSSCQNEDWEFPDFDYQTVYFAYQYPVRTITLGDDIFDTTNDNEGKFQILATTGGVYSSPKDVYVTVAVEESLTQGLLFNQDGDPVEALPSEYYQLAEQTIVIPKGEVVGGIDIQLNSGFFNDPKAIKNSYVLPLRITEIANADSVLSGEGLVPNPLRNNPADWTVQPKDFVLYALKYVNPWHGNYLRRGQDIIEGSTGNSGLDETVNRHEEFVEDDEVNSLITSELNEVEFPLAFPGQDGENISADLKLTFDESGNCTVSALGTGYSASGTGQFVSKGEKNSWGNKDRDVLYLSYEINLPEMQITSMDTLVIRDRGVGFETFTPVYSDN
ncbi:DUF5627 domain-containing protein [Algoriphagus sp. D3-2-R+10]|uniref:DUF5627 domain-containing protein n=1 Tax=Algoriphagus aurantiacus TaxID=3103948 RepID=UPI002B36D6EB|nr:DUF5627 domain-containing protein [Algoriphagus sp. D3-2-R+10]MEB2775347.1 DUF5627 domain-containing protein [Algoriphagus sp. D3-2-R+10]